MLDDVRNTTLRVVVFTSNNCEQLVSDLLAL